MNGMKLNLKIKVQYLLCASVYFLVINCTSYIHFSIPNKFLRDREYIVNIWAYWMFTWNFSGDDKRYEIGNAASRRIEKNLNKSRKCKLLIFKSYAMRFRWKCANKRKMSQLSKWYIFTFAFSNQPACSFGHSNKPH